MDEGGICYCDYGMATDWTEDAHWFFSDIEETLEELRDLGLIHIRVDKFTVYEFKMYGICFADWL